MPIARKSSRWTAALSLAWAGVAGVNCASGQTPRPVVVTRLEADSSSVGKSQAGTKVVIGPEVPAAPGTSYRWTQVEGPTVKIDNPTAPQIRVTVPREARSMAFSLAIKDAKGERTLLVPVPIGPHGAMRAGVANAPASAEIAPLAIAGGDTAGEVGHELVLDGSRSRPIGRVGHRWVQLSGPETVKTSTRGSKLTFVPTTPGTYRFALVVGLESRVSEPDVISVAVAPSRSSSNDPAMPAPAEPSPLSQWFAVSIGPIPRGEETASDVADAFEAVAGRVPLYTSYAQLQAELTRRLDVIIPTDPGIRNAWSERVFVPLSGVTANELKAVGIDPSVPPTTERVLDDAQKSRLHTIYRNLADACRPPSPKPGPDRRVGSKTEE